VFEEVMLLCLSYSDRISVCLVSESVYVKIMVGYCDFAKATNKITVIHYDSYICTTLLNMNLAILISQSCKLSESLPYCYFSQQELDFSFCLFLT